MLVPCWCHDSVTDLLISTGLDIDGMIAYRYLSMYRPFVTFLLPSFSLTRSLVIPPLCSGVLRPYHRCHDSTGSLTQDDHGTATGGL